MSSSGPEKDKPFFWSTLKEKTQVSSTAKIIVEKGLRMIRLSRAAPLYLLFESAVLLFRVGLHKLMDKY